MNEQQKRFVEEYLKDLNATRAAIRAGYSKKSAAQQGHELLRNPKVAAALTAAMEKRSARTEITQDKVVERLKHLSVKAEEAGQFAAAISAEVSLGKHVGMFTEKVEVSGRVEVDSSDIAQAIERFTSTVVQLSARTRAAGAAEDALARGDSPPGLPVGSVAREA